MSGHSIIGGHGAPLLRDLLWADATTPLALAATLDIGVASLYASVAPVEAKHDLFLVAMGVLHPSVVTERA